MSRYAENTDVSSERSRAEIERILARYGATGFMYGWQEQQALVAFEAHGKQVRFSLDLPSRDAFKRTPQRKTLRSPAQQASAYEQAVRQRWRALALVIKAKLEAVEAGITIFEQEFMAHIVIPGTGRTVSEEVLPRLERSYNEGGGVPLLPDLSS